MDGVFHEVVIGNRLAKVPKPALEGSTHVQLAICDGILRFLSYLSLELPLLGVKTLKKGEEAVVRVFQTLPPPLKPAKLDEVEDISTEQVVEPAESAKEPLGSWRLKLLDFENVELITTDRGIYKKIIKKFDPDQPLKDRKPEFESTAQC